MSTSGSLSSGSNERSRARARCVVLGTAIRAYDLQPDHVEAARAVCRWLLVGAGASDGLAWALAAQWVRTADFLVDKVEDREADRSRR